MYRSIPIFSLTKGQRSFITEDLAAKLNLQPVRSENITVASFGAESLSSQNLPVAQINIETQAGDLIPISVLIVLLIAAPLHHTLRTCIANYPYLKELKLAHPVTGAENFQISVLIGADFYWSFVRDKIIRGDGPTAQQSKLGYLLSGPLSLSTSQPTTTNMSHIAIIPKEVSKPTTEQFWLLETAGTLDEDVQRNDDTFLQIYQQTCITQNSDGTYTARFPWKPNHPYLSTNFTTAYKRTKSLISRLAQTNLLNIYNDIIMDQVRRGFIEQVDSAEPFMNTHYLPHHPVRKDSQITPIRIVYDCSCCQGKDYTSLNDCLMIGPPFLNDLCTIILRFHAHAYAFATDIEKAFLHVYLHQSDKDYTRFLWLSNMEEPNSELTTYCFRVVPFGTSSSPFMLHAALDFHLNQFTSEIATDMKQNLYVDNLISGCTSEENVITYYRQARAIMNKAKFNLRSWSSNSKELQNITSKDQTDDKNKVINYVGTPPQTL